MAELTPQDRLQPALLDRLVDDARDKRQPEPREQRLIGRRQMRECVLRDIEWLLNTTQPSPEEGVAGLPHAARSVLNYGLPAFSGKTASTIDLMALERMIRQAIIDHEPRVLADTLEVAPVVVESQVDHHNVISIEIRGELWADPVPISILLRTDVDLETGRVQIRDLAR